MGRFVHGRAVTVAAAVAAAVLVALGLLGASTAAVRAADPPAGPPFPDPVAGRHVYDYAHIWSSATVASAEATIAGWASRTGSQAVVYSQIVPDGLGQETARGQAADLGDAWRVGRAGFDDGLVVLFDIYPNLEHGQVAIVGGDGFRNTYLSDADAQHIFDSDMKPHLTGGSPDFDAALLAGLRAIDERVSPAGAARLQAARVIDALLGLVVAPLLGLLLLGWALFHWLRYGRDPHYLDDPSILMPAPPDSLTAATGALVFDGRSTRRTLTTALLDLASRGQLAFQDPVDGNARKGSPKVAIRLSPPGPTDATAATEQRLAARRPVSEAERYAYDELRSCAVQGLVENETLLEFGQRVDRFDELLEAGAVSQGWFAEPPTKTIRRWLIRGGLELAMAAVALLIGLNVPISGLVVVAVAVGIAGAATMGLAVAMPARTMPGAVIRAMLAAYRRTLQATMAQARSMRTVVEEAKLAWLETPDQALVWATALGLQADAERVLERSREDLQRGHAQPAAVWFPVWWSGGGHAGGWGGSSGGGGS
ncbi:MAG TPA: TPM domain-containing protein, partial [Candidatus Limnocylindrales bacterium]